MMRRIDLALSGSVIGIVFWGSMVDLGALDRDPGVVEGLAHVGQIGWPR